MINILVTGAGGGIGQGIIKSIKMINDIKIKIISVDMSPLAAGLYAGDISYIVPSCRSEKYIDTIIDICKKEKINFYFPGTDIELEICSINKKLFKNNYDIDIAVSDFNTIKITSDKYSTFKYLFDNNFFYPWTFLQEKVDRSSLKFPLIIKPRIGFHSNGVEIIENYEQLKIKLKDKSDYIIQELIGDDASEYTCTVVLVDDYVSEVVILKRVLRAGDTYQAEPVKSDIISNYIINVASTLKINGSCNFQLRIGSDGVPKIFEINCRFSGTTPFCSQLGLNPVELYIKKKRNIDYQYQINYKYIVMRYWSEILIEKKVIKSLSNDNYVSPDHSKKIDLFSG
jgi:carbamoyl-phosphate synthase large subunit